MVKTVPISNYKQAFFRMKKLVDDAYLISALPKQGKQILTSNPGKSMALAGQVGNILKRHEDPDNPDAPPGEVIDNIRKKYLKLSLVHLGNKSLKPKGIFDEALLRGAYEQAYLRRWSNETQLDEMKDFVDSVVLEDRRATQPEHALACRDVRPRTLRAPLRTVKGRI